MSEVSAKKRGLVSWLVEPSASLTDPDIRRQASLLSALLLVLIGFGISGVTSFGFDQSDPLNFLYALQSGGMTVGFAIIYGVSRTRHYRAAATTTTLALLYAIFGMIYPHVDASTLYWFTYLVIPILFSSLFLTIRVTIFNVVIAVAGMIVYGLVLAPTSFGNDMPIMFVVVVSTLIVVATHYRNLLEADRRKVLARSLELQAANERLDKLSKIKDQFVLNVSHELKSPITSLKLREEILARDPGEFDRHVEAIKRETERLELLIEDLLKLSRLDQGRTELNPAAVDLAWLARQMVEDRGPVAARKDIKLTLAEDAPVAVAQADPVLLSQVLGILVANAIMYVQPGGQITIQTHADHRDGARRVGFSVADTGPGITSEDLPHLFERFYRGSASKQSEAAGTGLGLAIAAEIIKQHGGSIEAASEGIPGRGATFTVWLSAAPS
jgi:signal transduction histidine kinase